VPPVRSEEFISYSRGSFELLRYVPIVGVVALPFTFGHGPISLTLALGAIPIAAIWLLSLLLMWRSGNQLLGGFGFIAVVGGSRLVGVHSPEVSLSQAIQWMCLVIILTGAPLRSFRAALLKFALLDQPANSDPTA